MANMHVLCDVWAGEINEDLRSSFFLLLGLFFSLVNWSELLVFELKDLSLVDLSDSLVDVLFLEEDVQEEARLVIWSLADLGQLDLLDSLIEGVGWDVFNDGTGHVLARLEPEGTLLLVLVEELHG